MPNDRANAVDVRATIAVADLPAALAFWTEVIGFDVEVQMGEPATFAMLRSDSAQFAIVQDGEPPAFAFCPMFVTVNDLAVVVLELAAAGIALEQEPTTRPWGIRDLVVRCPGGGPLVAFGQHL